MDGKEIAMAPMNGTIKRLVSDKGFGFILANDGNEYFFHNSACSQTPFDQLREGQGVTFDRGHGPKGPAAKTSVPPKSSSSHTDDAALEFSRVRHLRSPVDAGSRP